MYKILQYILDYKKSRDMGCLNMWSSFSMFPHLCHKDIFTYSEMICEVLIYVKHCYGINSYEQNKYVVAHHGG